MALAPGTVLGSCEILDLLGKGGMGEVYRGRDTRLGREVAIKALPDVFVHDHDRIARFDREAQVLASLNHPNIAAIYHLEEYSGSKYLVLELVDGETLSERIDRGPLPLDDTLEIALQIAEALGAAHDKGVVHRDLKPPNIKITTTGKVKVLDFGLAKIHEGSASGVVMSNSPTLSAIQSAAGVILGTAAYMSPEQARGRSVDKLADIWAFGCILYEMLTGAMIFPNGETVSDTLAGILARDPNWALLPAATPPRLRSLLQRCLSKDLRQRLQDIGDARIEIEEIRQNPTPAIAERPASRREYVFAGLALLFLAAAAILTWRLLRTPPAAAPVGVRFGVESPEGSAFIANSAPGLPKTPWPELSPDGKHLAFIASTGSKQQLWIRHMDSPVAQSLAGTDEAVFPTWSPDNESIAFLTQDKLKKISIAGGPPQVLGSATLNQTFGISWSERNLILVGRGNTGLERIPAAGGAFERLTELDATRKETAHRFPHFLPDGIHFTFIAFGPQVATFIGSLDSRERKPLPGIDSEAMYSAGHLLFVRDNILMAQSFDLKRMELKGDAFPLAQQISSNGRQAAFSASPAGSLAYRSGSTSSIAGRSQLAWFDSVGKPLGVAAPEGEYGNIDLSPDGRYVTFERGVPADVWVLDLSRGVTSRFTSNPGADAFPIWFPDGKSIAFSSAGPTTSNISRHAFGVIGEDEPIVSGGGAKFPVGWSGDGQYFVYVAAGQGTGFDIFIQNTAAGSKPAPLMETPFNETYVTISPDSHWIAYASNETGRYEVYVQSFPKLGPRQQASTSGGIMPKWSADGKKLFYVTPDSRINMVSVKSLGSSLEFSTPSPLFQVPIVGGGAYIGGQARNYDVAADGRFMVKVAVGDQAPAPIEVLINWPAVLKK